MLVLLEPQEQLDHKDHKDLLEQLVLKEHKESKEMLVLKVLKVRKVRKAFKVRLVRMAQTERTEQMELMERQDHKVLKVLKVLKDRQVLQELLAPAFRLEEQSDNCLQKRLRQIMILLGELQSPAEQHRQVADPTGTSTFNTYEHDSPFFSRTLCLHLRRW
jgi:hypothetical protein